MTAFVSGVGLWAPGFRDAAAWRAAVPDPAAVTAPAELLPPALRRRASPLSRMVAEAAGAAVAESAGDLGTVSIVLGSAYGEIASAVEMIASFREGEGLPSPMRFHNSVHNTPVAYVSMASGNRGLATAIAAGEETVAMALLEALAVLEERGSDVLLVLADEAVPPPLGHGRGPAGAVALVLSADASRSARLRLTGPRRGAAPAAELPVAAFATHPCAGAFALLTAVASRRAGAVSLGGADEGWVADLEPAGAP